MSEFVYFEKLVINKNVIVSLVEEEGDNSKVLTPMGTTFFTGERFETAMAKIKEADR